VDASHAAKAVGWLGESWGFWIQTGAFFLSAASAVAVIYYNGKQARTRALIDLLLHQKSDVQLIAATQAVYAMQKAGEQLSLYVGDSDGEKFKQILMVLNNREFIAVGIREGAFNESVYKELQCSNVLKLWGALHGFVAEVRKKEGKDTLFQDLERLAIRWKDKPISKVSIYRRIRFLD
jgi:hypothetical protein